MRWVENHRAHEQKLTSFTIAPTKQQIHLPVLAGAANTGWPLPTQHTPVPTFFQFGQLIGPNSTLYWLS